MACLEDASEADSSKRSRLRQNNQTNPEILKDLFSTGRQNMFFTFCFLGLVFPHGCILGGTDAPFLPELGFHVPRGILLVFEITLQELKSK